MADQKIEDSTSPLARRGARPFAGPTSAPVAGRPFIRPATNQRPTAAPFVPPVVPGKQALGSAPPPVATAATPVATESVASADDDSTAPPSRPLTSEMVALDAIDAFDAVWGASEPSSGAVEPQAVASPLDIASLGSGTDGQQLWAEDITAATDIAAGEPVTPSAPAPIDSTDGTSGGTMPAWLEDDAAADVVPTPAVDLESGSAASNVPSPPAAAWPATEVVSGYVVGEWTDSHTIPASDEIMGLPPEPTTAVPVPTSLGSTTPVSADRVRDEVLGAPDPQPRFELVEGPQAEDPAFAPVTAPTADARVPRETRIAATLDRLADRVRSGEIPVSSIAPDATDAAVLASVLAALLGGSSSR